ncbi:MAG TPA: enolase C-terminal domain-like protein [Terriglobia bacterium]|nr:enolase C-terminal domain-like protein [Terriglobia bacterium]
MPSHVIRGIETRDARFPLPPAAGVDAVHSGSEYAFAVTRLATDTGASGAGIALTLGEGNQLVCEAIRLLAAPLAGKEIEELMSGFGSTVNQLAEHPQLRWLGPHKGVVHLALASIVNACFDLWAKTRGVPLWRLLLDLSPEQVAALLDLTYLEDVLTREAALALLKREAPGRTARESVLRDGYPGYDTSVGWFQYEDVQVMENARRSMAEGFRAFKLKVGSRDGERDVRRAALLRETVGPEARLMLDANQQWTLPQALEMCGRLRCAAPYWIEEPTHPDDVAAHRALAEAVAPVSIALGEHVPNRVMFKNFIQAQAVNIVQVDCTRVAGVSEFIAVSLMARQAGLPVIPHVGDMGQIHQHLTIFNHIALGHEQLFLEYIPHLKDHFVDPAEVHDGIYLCPQRPGAGTELR